MYGILLAQLLVTAIIVGTVVYKKDQLQDPIDKAWILAAIIALVSVLALVFGTKGGDDKKKGSRLHMCYPYNMILLSIFTVSISVVVAKIALLTSK